MKCRKPLDTTTHVVPSWLVERIDDFLNTYHTTSWWKRKDNVYESGFKLHGHIHAFLHGWFAAEMLDVEEIKTALKE